MKELSENVENMLDQMIKQLTEVSGETFIAHDIVMKFRRSLLDHANQED